MKSIGCLALVFLITVLGCASKPQSIVGTWELQPSEDWVEKSKASGNAPPAGEFTFSADGTCHLTRAADGGRMDISGTYTVTGDKVEVMVKEINGQISPNPEGTRQVGTLSNGRSALTINGLTFVR